MVVAVGAHYRSQALTKEDLLLHVVNVSPLQGCRPSPLMRAGAVFSRAPVTKVGIIRMSHSPGD